MRNGQTARTANRWIHQRKDKRCLSEGQVDMQPSACRKVDIQWQGWHEGGKQMKASTDPQIHT